MPYSEPNFEQASRDGVDRVIRGLRTKGHRAAAVNSTVRADLFPRRPRVDPRHPFLYVAVFW